MSSKTNLMALLIGILFALGLGLGGMTDPVRIFGFLDITGAFVGWDPTLAFVMMGALGMHILIYRLAVRRGAPIFGQVLDIPTRRDIDGRLIAGAVLFGAGWGLSGFCPGPALASLVSGSSAVWVFVATMTVGIWLHHIAARSGRLGPTG